MIGNSFARLTGSKRNLLALLATSFVFTSGCANMSSTAPVSNSLSTPASLSGKIHGGNQPVIGATVQLWYAGQSTGFSPTLGATTTTDSTGSFTFTKNPTNGQSPAGNMYSCPSSTDPLVYVMSKGGNTQNNGNATQSNSAAAFIAIYDVCSRLSGANFVYMSEVTTAATMAAIGQFFNPSTETISADGTGQQYIIMTGLSKTVALLADTTTGLSKASTDLSAASPVGHTGNINPAVVVTATPEQSKLNLIANILSACVNSASASDAPCVSLLAAAAPPIANTTNFNATYGSNTDTLQVLYALFQNPSSNSSAGTGGAANITTLFGLAGGVGAPYQPSLATAPTDWTLGVQYASKGNVSCGTPTGGTGDFINSPVDITIDAFNNVWFANSQTGGNLSELSSSGAPATCVNLDAGKATSLAIDGQQSVWLGAGTTMYRYSPGGFSNITGIGLTAGTLPFPTGGLTPLAVTADGVDNVYFTATASSTGSVYLLSGAAKASAVVAPPTQISSTVGASPLRLFPDFKGSATQGDIWVTSGSTFVSQVQPSTGSGNLGGFITNPFTVSGTDSYGVTVSHGNNIFVSDLTSGAITRLDPSGTTWVPASSGWPFTATTAGISSPTGIAIDGRLNTWIPNNANGTSTGSLSEISFFGANPLSPSTGFQKTSSLLNSSRAVAIDQAGNVWVVGDGNNYITELVGSAVPIFQPVAIGLKFGRFQNLP
jgi:hypothetical protein